jgi:hypothetical protein
VGGDPPDAAVPARAQGEPRPHRHDLEPGGLHHFAQLGRLLRLQACHGGVHGTSLDDKTCHSRGIAVCLIIPSESLMVGSHGDDPHRAWPASSPCPTRPSTAPPSMPWRHTRYVHQLTATPRHSHRIAVCLTATVRVSHMTIASNHQACAHNHLTAALARSQRHPTLLRVHSSSHRAPLTSHKGQRTHGWACGWIIPPPTKRSSCGVCCCCFRTVCVWS